MSSDNTRPEKTFPPGTDDEFLASCAIALLRKRGLTISVAESLTGGMVSSMLIGVSGASSVFVEGIVAYRNESKIQRLQVTASTLQRFGAISRETAAEMAHGSTSTSGATVGLSLTGVAGPERSEGHPPGTVHLGIYLAREKRLFTRTLQFSGNRNEIRQQVAKAALSWLSEILEEKPETGR